MNLKQFFISIAFLSVLHCVVLAQDATNENKTRINFRGRLLNDYTVSSLGSETAKAYYKIEDFRLGFAAVNGDYTFSTDFGFSNRQVSIKDLYLKYTKNNESIWIFGNAYEPFSLDMLVSTKDMYFHQSAASALALIAGRKLGLTYHLNKERYYWALGAYSDSDINDWDTEVIQAYALTSRYIYRSRNNAQTFFHVGAAASFRTVDNNKSSSQYQTVTYSTVGVSSMLGEDLFATSITNSKYQFKSVFEFLVMKKKFRVQSELYNSYVARNSNLTSHLTYGGYVQASYLLKGSGFKYYRDFALVSSPNVGSIELTFRYDQLKMSKIDINPESFKRDVSVGLNYYISKHLAIKINSSYVYDIKGGNTFYGNNYFLNQLRLQIYT